MNIMKLNRVLEAKHVNIFRSSNLLYIPKFFVVIDSILIQMSQFNQLYS